MWSLRKNIILSGKIILINIYNINTLRDALD